MREVGEKCQDWRFFLGRLDEVLAVFGLQLRCLIARQASSAAAHGRQCLGVADEKVGEITGSGLQARCGDESGVDGRGVRYGCHFDDDAPLLSLCPVEALDEIIHGRFCLRPVDMPHGQRDRIIP